jgi:hypothetical protein
MRRWTRLKDRSVFLSLDLMYMRSSEHKVYTWYFVIPRHEESLDCIEATELFLKYNLLYNTVEKEKYPQRSILSGKYCFYIRPLNRDQ